MFDFLLLAFSTISNIFEAVDSEKSLVTCTVNKAFLFINPDNKLSPFLTVLSTDSPVNAEVSIIELPSITTPSRGTFSPGFTII